VEAVGLLQGRSLKGVTYGDALPPELIGQLVQLHREGALPLEKLEKTYSLKQIQQAAEDMRHGVTIKPVIVF
jgi:aryl-alcohol dehydrogenase